MLIGEKMAERLKMEIGSVFFNEDEDISTDIKGGADIPDNGLVELVPCQMCIRDRRCSARRLRA